MNEYEAMKEALGNIVEAGRPHGRNPMVCIDGPCECDYCEAWAAGKRLLAEIALKETKETGCICTYCAGERERRRIK